MQQIVQQVILALQILQKNGLVLFPTNIELNTKENIVAKSNSPTTLTVEQILAFAEIQQAVYQKGLEDARKQAQIEQNANIINFEEAKERIRIKKAGLVSSTIIFLIISIFVIILGILLILKM